MGSKRRNCAEGWTLIETDKIFVYGILKRGFKLDLSKYGGTFLHTDTVFGTLYRIGSGVGLRLGGDGLAHGEIFEIPRTLWGWLDEIEQVDYNVYTRRYVKTDDGDFAHLYEHTAYVGKDTDPDWYYENRLRAFENGVFE